MRSYDKIKILFNFGSDFKKIPPFFFNFVIFSEAIGDLLLYTYTVNIFVINLALTELMKEL